MRRVAFTVFLAATLLLGLQVRMACTHGHDAPVAMTGGMGMAMHMAAHHETPVGLLADLQCKANCSAAFFLPASLPAVSTPVLISFAYGTVAPRPVPGVIPLPDPLPPRALRQI